MGHGITLSLHAPYFINLANPDPEALQKTIGYITGACLVADWMGAGRVVGAQNLLHSVQHPLTGFRPLVRPQGAGVQVAEVHAGNKSLVQRAQLQPPGLRQGTRWQ